VTAHELTGDPLWTPTQEGIADANITRFQDFVASTRGLTFADYNELWTWSSTDIEGFWSALWQFCELDKVSGYERVLVDAAMPGAQWFPGARLNFADYLLAQGEPDAVAIVSTDESGTVSTLSRAELRRQVGALAGTLRSVGVQAGDVVVGYLPSSGEGVVAFLATASLGAVWSCVGQDYAAPAVVARFGQLNPKVLITADGYRFNGRLQNRVDAVAAVRQGLTSVSHTIMIDRLGTAGDADGDWQGWPEATAGTGALEPVALPFDHPLWVLFSSGTTGLPKGLVHGHGGILLETLKQMGLHWNLGAGKRLFWFTSTSWVMWNLQLSALATGASIVCYDGSPTYPDPSAMWRLVAELDVTFFGLSPGLLQAAEGADVHPAVDFDLSRLEAMGSTGSPISPHSHRWAREQVGNLPLWSLSGGTDIAGAFMGGSPTVPVWSGELSVRCLGVALESWDEQGQAVYGEVGELVVRRPLPSMPIYFWNDPDGSKYTDAYFSTFPGVWRHGDWITVTSRGSVVIHGRSDSTLNRQGVRMGSGDIYAAVENIPEITEALVIGAEQPDGTYWMPLFVVLRSGQSLDDALVDRIKSAIRERTSPRHVPDEVIQVPGIPHTRTGKKLELPVKRLLQGAPAAKVVNPDSVDDASLFDIFARMGAQRRG
jgi:acetoacetyl-CoA synthetase